jgi:hypothetical protein
MMSFLTYIMGFFMNFGLLPAFEEISIFSNGGHLGWRAGLSDTILKGTHQGTNPTRFDLIWFSGFREEDLNVIFYQNMQNVHKFELYKHNDELFNIYYGIFYELWTFADFDRLKI